jgi:hypothetical protein
VPLPVPALPLPAVPVPAVPPPAVPATPPPPVVPPGPPVPCLGGLSQEKAESEQAASAAAMIGERIFILNREHRTKPATSGCKRNRRVDQRYNRLGGS